MLETKRILAGRKTLAGDRLAKIDESLAVLHDVTLLLPWFDWRPIRSPLDDKSDGYFATYLAGQGIDMEAIGYVSTKDTEDVSVHLRLFLKDGRWVACGGLGREIYVPEVDVEVGLGVEESRRKLTKLAASTVRRIAEEIKWRRKRMAAFEGVLCLSRLPPET